MKLLYNSHESDHYDRKPPNSIVSAMTIQSFKDRLKLITLREWDQKPASKATLANKVKQEIIQATQMQFYEQLHHCEIARGNTCMEIPARRIPVAAVLMLRQS